MVVIFYFCKVAQDSSTSEEDVPLQVGDCSSAREQENPPAETIYAVVEKPKPKPRPRLVLPAAVRLVNCRACIL